MIKRIIADCLPDKLYLSLLFHREMGYWMDWNNPKTFNEKLQWLKLYNRKPEYTIMADKVKAKEWVAERIGAEYIIPTLGVWDDPDDIDFDKLPNQFVIKCSHNSGLGMYICKDKSKMDVEVVKQGLREGLKENYYLHGREWPYKNVPKRIIAEKYMADDSIENRGGLTDYKFYCFNGKAYKVMLCLDRNTGNTKFYSFDKQWNLLRHNKMGIAAPKDFTLPKPAKMDEMFNLAERLSQDIPLLRVDLYYVNGRIYFGELTFFPDSGLDANIIREIDELYGSMIKLPNN